MATMTAWRKVTRVAVGLFMLVLLVQVVAPGNELPYVFWAAVALTGWQLVEVLVAFAQARKTTLTRAHLTAPIVGVFSTAVFAVVCWLRYRDLVTGRLFAGLLLLALTVLPWTVLMALGPLVDRTPNVLRKAILFVVVFGALTAGQVFLISEFDTWLFLMVGILPIPVLGITLAITSVATAGAAMILAVATVFHPIRVTLRVQ